MAPKPIEDMEQARYERALVMDSLLLILMVMVGLGALCTLVVGIFSL